MKNFLDAKVGINVLNEAGETNPRFFEQLFFSTCKQWLHHTTPLIQLETLQARWQNLHKRTLIKELPVEGQWVRCATYMTHHEGHEATLQALIFDEQGQVLAWQETRWQLISRIDQPATLPTLTYPQVPVPAGFPFNIDDLAEDFEE